MLNNAFRIMPMVIQRSRRRRHNNRTEDTGDDRAWNEARTEESEGRKNCFYSLSVKYTFFTVVRLEKDQNTRFNCIDMLHE